MVAGAGVRVVWVVEDGPIGGEVEVDLVQAAKVGAWQVEVRQVPTSRECQRMLLDELMKRDDDLIVFRCPSWLVEAQMVEEAIRLFAHRPAVVWCSEQGPTRSVALAAARGWPRVAVNNRVDEAWYGRQLPKQRILYLPFGCAEWMDSPDSPGRSFYEWRQEWAEVGEYPRADFVADGGCHYACSEDGGWKRESVRVMVEPLLDQRLALYGHGPADHGWLGVPGAETNYRGRYEPARHWTVYAAAKIYVGITWNWAFGGYGIKLARALAAGIPVLWHRTYGMELEGLAHGEHLWASATPEETRTGALWLLSHEEDQQRLAAAGRAFALREWEWGANLKRLVQEVARDG